MNLITTNLTCGERWEAPHWWVQSQKNKKIWHGWNGFLISESIWARHCHFIIIFFVDRNPMYQLGGEDRSRIYVEFYVELLLGKCSLFFHITLISANQIRVGKSTWKVFIKKISLAVASSETKTAAQRWAMAMTKPKSKRSVVVH